MKTIVALIDFSDISERVLEQTRQFAKAFASQVFLLHVVPKEPVVVGFGLASPTILQPPDEAAVKADAEKLLRLQLSLAGEGINVSAHQLREGSVESLLKESERVNADLIILGSHHHGALYNWFVGTFTSSVLKSANCPVLVVPKAP